MSNATLAEALEFLTQDLGFQKWRVDKASNEEKRQEAAAAYELALRNRNDLDGHLAAGVVEDAEGRGWRLTGDGYWLQVVYPGYPKTDAGAYGRQDPPANDHDALTRVKRFHELRLAEAVTAAKDVQARLERNPHLAHGGGIDQLRQLVADVEAARKDLAAAALALAEHPTERENVARQRGLERDLARQQADAAEGIRKVREAAAGLAGAANP
jgi:hypothetical protein